ncbi:FixH family protein [Roseimarinus sediminis]|uniref:FixH family protein n=1 Tax=Roseimarinus sediminis TaxID=1610899 RepID=UPI003D1C45A5
MKQFNWGHGILLAIILSVLGILTMVFLSFNERIDLVSEDYYPRELVYEEQIEKMRNTAALPTPIRVSLNESIQIVFPEFFKHQHEQLKGEVWFYRASDRFADFRDSILLDSTLQLSYPLEQFIEGKYDLFIDYSDDKKHYLHKETIMINNN